MTSEKVDFAKFVAEYLASLCFVLQEILQSHRFMMSEKFETRFANGSDSNGLNLFSRIRGIVEQKFWTPLYCLK